MAKKDVLIYVTKYGFEYELSAKIYYSIPRRISFPICAREQTSNRPKPPRKRILTLARKLLAVHKKTVTSNKNIPSALLPTFSNPILALRPFRDLSSGGCEDEIDNLTKCSDGRGLRAVGVAGVDTSKSSGAARTGTGDICALMVFAR